MAKSKSKSVKPVRSVSRSNRKAPYYKPRYSGIIFEDLTSDYMSAIGLLLSIVGLLMRIKWCGWIAIYASLVVFTCSRSQDDIKQIMSSFMLSASAVIVSYMQNPAPMTMPFSS